MARLSRHLAKLRAPTLSVGETAKRFDVSPDTVRNYCERGWLQCIRVRGNHRRILLKSIQSFEAQRRPDRVVPLIELPKEALTRKLHEDIELYYLGNDCHPSSIEPGFVCHVSFFSQVWQGELNFSTLLVHVGKEFGGGKFRFLEVRDGEVIRERTVSLPGPTKDCIEMIRSIVMER